MTIRMTTKFGLAVLTAATLSGAAIAQEAGTDTRSPSPPPRTKTNPPCPAEASPQAPAPRRIWPPTRPKATGS